MDQGPARGVAAHADRPWAAAAAVAGALGAAALTVLAARARLHAGQARQASGDSVAASLRAADAEQVQMMSEEIIVVDEADTALRAGSKKETHEWKAIKGDKLLHRAFSVFLLSPDGRLLVQQRSDAKVTFPGYWANTCCSHPWYVPEEMIVEGGQGVKVAARRKLQQELGINPEDVPLECFTFLTRVHYEAMCDDGVWGEHEVDHVLIATPNATPTLRVNANEVQAVKWLTLTELKSWMAAHAAADSTGATADKVSPWFRIISEQHLPTWWEAVLADQGDGIPPSSAAGRLQALVEPHTIHRATDWDATRKAAN